MIRTVVGRAWRWTPRLGRDISCTPIRSYAKPSRAQVARDLKQFSRGGGGGGSAIRSSNPVGDTMSAMQRTAHAAMFKDGDGPLFPGTFVPLPWAMRPRKPSQLLKYQWTCVKLWLLNLVTISNLKLKSMPGWKRPRWKARRSAIAPTAKALYREMLEAYALGDCATLQRICVGSFAKRLNAALDRRDPCERVRFELVRYNKPLIYPRLLCHQVQQPNIYDQTIVTEQAVVAVASTQVASRHDAATDALVPGSLKLQDKVEYVVLSRSINQSTFESGSWRLWGTTSPTTLEAFQKEQAILEQEQNRRWA